MFDETGTMHLMLPGTPVAKPRMTQKDKYFPSKAVLKYYAWKDLIVASIGYHRPREPFVIPITLSAKFFLPVPPSIRGRARQARLDEPHRQVPDLKNLVAALEDAFNGVLWLDDSQIVAYKYCFKCWVNDEQGWTSLKLERFRGKGSTKCCG